MRPRPELSRSLPNNNLIKFGAHEKKIKLPRGAMAAPPTTTNASHSQIITSAHDGPWKTHFHAIAKSSRQRCLSEPYWTTQKLVVMREHQIGAAAPGSQPTPSTNGPRCTKQPAPGGYRIAPTGCPDGGPPEVFVS